MSEGGPLQQVRVCDFSGQLAGAGSTRILATLGAEVIRIEDPATNGAWDLLRATGASPNMSPGFNSHNVEKLGVTINIRTERGRQLVEQLVARSDVVTENFAAGVLERRGLGFERLREVKPDIIYVSNCGFGHSGPYRPFKTWGPIVQAISGLTFASGLPEREPAGWGYSYMDHMAANFMALAILAALHHRARTGEGQWIDMAATETGLTLHGPALLDWTVNGRPMRRPGRPNGNRADHGEMAPHGIYPCVGVDQWVALACRDDDDWAALAKAIDDTWCREERFATLPGRLAHADSLDAALAQWTSRYDKFDIARLLLDASVPASPVKTPRERIDEDADVTGWGLWPTVEHPEMGPMRVDGMPIRFERDPSQITRPAPCVGEHNDVVFRDVLGLEADEIDSLREEGVI